MINVNAQIVNAQASLAKVLFLANLQIRPGFWLESNARVRQNLRKGEQLRNALNTFGE
jgi:hypothetical protein